MRGLSSPQTQTGGRGTRRLWLRLTSALMATTVVAGAGVVLSSRPALAASSPGSINLVAGGNNEGDGGPPRNAVVKPVSVAVDSVRHILYITDSSNKVRAVTAGADGVIGKTSSSGQFTDTDDVITTVAGNGADGGSVATNAVALGDNGPATSALLSGPEGLAIDSAGNLYIADFGDNRVRFVCQTSGGCLVPGGALLPQGDITTIAGTGQGMAGVSMGKESGDGAAAAAATVWNPWGLVLDSSGNLLVVDQAAGSDGSVRFVCVNGNGGSSVACTTTASGTPLPKGDITSVAGNNTVSSFANDSGDGGLATSAVLNAPTWITVDSAGNFYLEDVGAIGTSGAIRKVDTSGKISLVMNGCTTSPSIGGLGGIQVTSDGTSLYLSEIGCGAGNQSFVARITLATLAVTPVAGNGTDGFSGDGGLATSAQINGATSIAIDTAGDLFMAQQSSTIDLRVRQVTAGADGVLGKANDADDFINTVAGNGSNVYVGDGGPAVSAGMLAGSLATDSAGDVFIADGQSGSRVRFVCQKPATSSCTTPFGVVTGQNITTVAGGGTSGYSGDGGSATAAALGTSAIALDPNGNLFISEGFGPTSGNGIRFVCMKATSTNCSTPFGLVGGSVITTIAGNQSAGGYSGDGSSATQALLSGPRSMAFDAVGNLYFDDHGNNRVRFVCMQQTTCNTAFGQVASGNIITVAGNGRTNISGDGGPALSAGVTTGALALDNSGNLYISSGIGGPSIRSVCVQLAICGTPSGMLPPGFITTVAGNGSTCAWSTTSTCGDGGLATAASLDLPSSLATDRSGNLYLADQGAGGGNVVRFICMQASCPSYLSPTAVAQGDITTIAGNGTGASTGNGGAASMAGVANVSGLTADATNNLFISDAGVREVTAPVTVQPYPAPLFAGFSTQQVGVTGGTLTITLQNPTSGTITVNSTGASTKGVAIAGTNAGDFSLVGGGDHCSGVAIGAGGSCTVQVQDTPQGFGRRTATLTFTDSGGPTTSQTATLVALADSTKVGVVGSDSALYTKQDQQGYQNLGGTLVAPPAMVSVPGAPGSTPMVLYVVVGSDHNLYVRSDSQNWQTLSSVGVSCLDTAGAAVSPASGGGYTLTVACQGSDHGLYYAQTAVTAGTLPQVSSWTGLGGTLSAGPQVTYLGSTVYFVVEGGGGQLYQTTPTSGYTVINGTCIAHPATASNGSTAYLACHGGDGALYYATNSGGGWGGFVNLGGVLLDAPGVSLTTTQLTFFVEGSNHALYHRVLPVGSSTAGPYFSDGGALTYGPGAVGMLAS